MTSIIIACVLIAYFGVLLTIAYLTSRNASANSFFTGDKKSPWYLVAFGMIGTSLSGVTFVSVPGAVSTGAWHYYQLVLGFFARRIFVGFPPSAAGAGRRLCPPGPTVTCRCGTCVHHPG